MCVSVTQDDFGGPEDSECDDVGSVTTSSDVVGQGQDGALVEILETEVEPDTNNQYPFFSH